MKSIQSIADLTPDDANARAHTPRNIGMIAQAVQEVGVARSGVIDETGKILAGNGTYEALAQAGIERVKVVDAAGDEWVLVRRTGLTEEQKARLSLYDNRAAELASWSPEALQAIAENHPAAVAAVFRPEELAAIVGRNGKAAGAGGDEFDTEKQYPQRVAYGDLWQIGEHRLLCGDSTKREDVERLMRGDKPGLLHTDPPYGIQIVRPKEGGLTASDGGSKPFGSTSGTNRKSSTGFDSARLGSVQRGPKSKNQIIQSNLYPMIHGDDKPFDPTPFLSFAPTVILWGANYYADKLPISSCWICWDKREDITRNSFADCELAWCSEKKPARVFHHLWNGLHKGSQHGERRTHPTEKPIALFMEIGNMFCQGGVWVDLFAGSGAQIIAAERSGARCYACEIEPLYGDVILARAEAEGLTVELVERVG